jgi:hypothetical protein
VLPFAAHLLLVISWSSIDGAKKLRIRRFGAVRVSRQVEWPVLLAAQR